MSNYDFKTQSNTLDLTKEEIAEILATRAAKEERIKFVRENMEAAVKGVEIDGFKFKVTPHEDTGDATIHYSKPDGSNGMVKLGGARGSTGTVRAVALVAGIREKKQGWDSVIANSREMIAVCQERITKHEAYFREYVEKLTSKGGSEE